MPGGPTWNIALRNRAAALHYELPGRANPVDILDSLGQKETAGYRRYLISNTFSNWHTKCFRETKARHVASTALPLGNIP